MADKRGRDGGFAGAGRKHEGRPGDKKTFGEKKSFGEKRNFGDKKPFGEKKGFGDKKPFGDRKSFGDRKPFGERKPFTPREQKPKAMNLAPRRVALETLLDVSRSDAFASLALDKRLAQAAFLLKNTDRNVADIAVAVGYENISYFHRIFSAAYGISPKHYRDAK